jgi:hypothetical protein
MARQPQPCLLHRILGVRLRSEHPLGHRHKAPALLLERLRYGMSGCALACRGVVGSFERISASKVSGG